MQEPNPITGHTRPSGTGVSATTRANDLVRLAEHILAEAAARGVVLRLFGGLAIWDQCPGSRRVQMRNDRNFSDIDLVGYLKSKERTETLFRELGYPTDPALATVPGLRRSVFFSPSRDVRFDLCYDVLEFCHVIDLRRRLEIHRLTVPLMELLLQKLQIVELSHKDLVDTQALLREHPITASDNDGINAVLLAHMCSRDWGLWQTVTRNLVYIRDLTVDDSGLSVDDIHCITGRIEELQTLILDAPKSLRWRLRGLVGTKVRWYTQVEVTDPARTDRSIVGHA